MAKWTVKVYLHWQIRMFTMETGEKVTKKVKEHLRGIMGIVIVVDG